MCGFVRHAVHPFLVMNGEKRGSFEDILQGSSPIVPSQGFAALTPGLATRIDNSGKEGRLFRIYAFFRFFVLPRAGELLYPEICFHAFPLSTITMPTIHRRPYLSLCELAGSPMRSDRLLRGMQKVFSHDLPNEMVVLQSLLQLLDQEESSRLSDDGHEYIRRLQSATKRTSGMIRFLKEMARLSAFTIKSETVPLAALARELQGELQRSHPATQFEFAWQWNAPTIVGDSRVFLQAILGLCACSLQPNRKKCRVSATSEQQGDSIELAFHLDGRKESPPQSLEQRMEIILAREWLALCGVDIEVTQTDDGELCFSLVVPNR
jgi:signal transduction histidine kinase